MCRPLHVRCVCALAVALVGACAAPRREAAAPAGDAPAGEVRVEARPVELLVEVLPRSALVALDGRALGPGSRTIPAPRPGEHRLAVQAPGFAAAERELPEGDLAGVRVAVVLRPEGFAAAGPLDYDDPEGLALAAAFMVRNGEARDALDYASRALELDRRVALAHRARGDALHRLGEEGRAAAAWDEYLRLRPDAPDAAAVGRRISEARGGAGAPP
jgi:hypothetical protein